MSGTGVHHEGTLSEAQLPELTQWRRTPLPSTSQGGRPPVLLALGAQLAGIVDAACPQAPPRVAQQACLIGSIQVGQAGLAPVQQQFLLELTGWACRPCIAGRPEQAALQWAAFRLARRVLVLTPSIDRHASPTG